jgi:HK97 family phage major capsid protein
VGGNFNNTALLGYNLQYGNDIPAVAAGALAAAFGDFKQGYVIVDRIGISVLRDAYTNKPNIVFYTRKRTGGDVDNFDAIKLQVLT